jgi:hypothetical protein
MSLRRAKTLSRRSRLFVLWFAQLALVAYLFQLAAIDHWQADVNHIVGLEGSASHVQHCHGGGDCSDASGSVTSLPAPLLTAVPPEPVRTGHFSADARPHDAFIASFSTPPRTA